MAAAAIRWGRAVLPPDITASKAAAVVGSGDLSYRRCLRIMAEHQCWIGKDNLACTGRQRRWQRINSLDNATGGNGAGNAVIVGYLEDNSLDLLLSALACMDLDVSASDVIPPAMKTTTGQPQ